MLSKAEIGKVAKTKYGLRMAALAKDAFKDNIDTTENGLIILGIVSQLAKSQKKKTISGPMALACCLSWKQGKL